jgi:hypothetical protein
MNPHSLFDCLLLVFITLLPYYDADIVHRPDSPFRIIWTYHEENSAVA